MTLTVQGEVLHQNGGNIEPVKVVLHSAAPNATGTTNRIGALQACAFDLATELETSRFLSEDVVTTISGGITTATHFSVYNSTDVCIHIVPLTTPRTGLVDGDTVTLKTADTALSIS